MHQRRQLTRVFCSAAAVFAAIVQAMSAVDGVRAQTVSSDLYEVLAGHENLTSILTGQPREQKYYSGWPPHLVATRTVGGAQTLRYDNYNLLVTIPERHWYDLNPNRNKPNVDVLIGRRNPTMIAALSAERVGIESNQTNESLLTWSEARMKRTPGCVVLSNERVVEANGFFGIAYEATGHDDSGMAHYSNWVATRNGYNYCLCVSGRQNDVAAVMDATIGIVRGIRQIDPDKVAHKSASSSAESEPSVAQLDAAVAPQIKFSR